MVSIHSPQEMREEMHQEGLSVWLYRIERDDQRLNVPDERISSTQARKPPLPLRLHYLITPVTFGAATGGSPGVEQQVLGRAMQALHSQPVLRGIDLANTDFEGTDVELHIRLETLALDELSLVWEALEGSFQLAISYEVSVVNIDAALEPRRVAPVDIALPEVAIRVGEFA